MRCARVLLSAIVLGSCAGANAPPADVVGPDDVPLAAGAVAVRVSGAARHQTLDGFGATTLSLAYDAGTRDNLAPALRRATLEAVYTQIGLSTGNLEIGGIEPANDDDDPNTINWAGFRLGGARAMQELVVAPARAYGLDNGYPAYKIDLRWAMPWLASLRAHDYGRYLDECAEHVAAGLLDWKRRTGSLPRYVLLFNEPRSGNTELLPGAPASEVVDIVKRTGARLGREGLGTVKFVVPGEETESKSLETATAILADPEARQYVGALAYHPYPYGSTYASVPNILRTSGRGAPDAGALDVRRRLRALGQQSGIPVWMTEVSHAEADALGIDHLRGRAIHIHDELTYADAAAYFGMNAFWDSKSHVEHFGNTRLLDEMDSPVLVDQTAGRVIITGMGYAIAHYARWARPGAVRVEATSADPLVQVTAFRDDRARSLALVLINNRAAPATVDVRLSDLATTGVLRGEVSAGNDRLRPLGDIAVQAGGRFILDLPAQSVTSVGGRY